MTKRGGPLALRSRLVKDLVAGHPGAGHPVAIFQKPGKAIDGTADIFYYANKRMVYRWP